MNARAMGENFCYTWEHSTLLFRGRNLVCEFPSRLIWYFNFPSSNDKLGLLKIENQASLAMR